MARKHGAVMVREVYKLKASWPRMPRGKSGGEGALSGSVVNYKERKREHDANLKLAEIRQRLIDKGLL